MKITICGDYSPQYRLGTLLEKEDYSAIFGDIKPIFANSDYNIVNFESTIPTNANKAIKKIGPNLSCSEKAVDALQWAGVNVVTLANNHAGDYGPKSLMNTISLLDQAKIYHVGAGKNLDEARKILYLEKGGEVLAVINCCEHEYGVAYKNNAGTNPLDSIAQYHAILEARKIANYVLVIVHGAAEGFQLPTIRMQDTYRFFIDAGADAVINHHQHCYSGIEIYKEKPIYYGLGNFAFDYSNDSKKWSEGIITTLDFNEGGVSHKYTPYIQFGKQVGIHPVKDTTEFDQKIEELSVIISDRQKLEECVGNYFAEWQSTICSRLQPYSGRILKGLYSRRLLPSLLTKTNIRLLQNMVNCETHRERLQYFLNFNN